MKYEHEPVPDVSGADIAPLPEPHELMTEFQDNLALIDALLDRNQAITNYLKVDMRQTTCYNGIVTKN